MVVKRCDFRSLVLVIGGKLGYGEASAFSFVYGDISLLCVIEIWM